MPLDRTMPTRAGRLRRRTFAAQLFGLSPDNHIDQLKDYLHAARLTGSRTEKLDLVVLEDYDHYTEIIAEHGIPLARSDGDVVVVQKVRYVKVRSSWALVLGVIGGALILDDLLTALHVVDLFPWF